VTVTYAGPSRGADDPDGEGRHSRRGEARACLVDAGSPQIVQLDEPPTPVIPPGHLEQLRTHRTLSASAVQAQALCIRCAIWSRRGERTRSRPSTLKARA
jgi:hypothetical protein